MVRTLEQAIAQISRLPDADQEQIGRKLLAHVEHLKALRTEIDKGIQSLDESKGSALNMEDFLRDKNSRHGGA
jgi:transposase